MTFFTIKVLKGKEYVYLEKREWIHGHPKRTFQKYIGPRELFPDLPIGKKAQKKKQQQSFSRKKVFHFGVSAALWKIAQDLNISGIIDQAIGEQKTPNLSMGEYLILAAINRVEDPGSKSQLSSWFEHSWISTQFEIQPQILNAQTYWNHFQRLTPELFEKVEVTLGKLIHIRYHLPLDHVFYDSSNIFTYGKRDGETGLRHNGHSKQNQNGLPLINFYLLCSKPYGIPLLHQTYAGNDQDAKTFRLVPAKVLQHLNSLGLISSQFTLCFDKGNLSPEGMAEIDLKNLFFIASLRNSTHKDLLHIPLSELHQIILPQSKKEVRYWKTTRNVYGQNRTLYVVFDPAKNKKQSLLFQEKLRKKTQILDDFIRMQLNVKMWRDEAKVSKKLTCLIGKSPWNQILPVQISGTFGQLQVSYQIDQSALTTHEETLGRAILFTNRHDWAASDVIWGYREQYHIEHAFRTMKDPQTIAIRPVYHSNAKCIEAHIFTCVLALFLMAILRLTLAQRGLYFSYEALISPLRQLHLIKEWTDSDRMVNYQLEELPQRTIKLVKLLHLESLVPEE